MPSHEYFRELSALAAIGQLSADEDRQLSRHLQECTSCREAHHDYALVIQHRLPQADAVRWRIKSGIPRLAPDADVRDRFLARARTEGIEFSPEVEQRRSSSASSFLRTWDLGPALAVVALGAVSIIGMWASRWYQLVPRSRTADQGAVQLTYENAGLRAQLVALRQSIQDESSRLDQMKRENSVSKESLERFKRQLEEARAEADKLSAALQQAESRSASLAADSQQKESTITDLRDKNDKLRREKADSLSERLILEAQVRDLTDSLQQKTANLERERQLMTVSKDVRQLIGARNLHIIDVHDVDGGGKSAKAFGRVFYAEGQSLIFYAFDLPSGKLTPAKYTFQAWGQREYVAHSIRNLGTFAVDDHEQRRWVLKVTDPALLHDIDSVFVTAEALGDTKEPRGRKLLYAYIVGQPNHP